MAVAKIRSPRTKGVAKCPTILQMENLECGAACLAMVLGYYRRFVPLEQLRMDCGVSRDGSNAGNILRAGRKYGLNAEGYRMGSEDLASEGNFPCVLFWEYNHFVVLMGVRGKRFFINDPARGVYSLREEDFNRSFSGVVLQFEPGEDFAPGGEKKGILRYARKRIIGMKKAVIFILLTTILAYLFDMMEPAFTRVFLDRILTGENPDWVVPFFLLLTTMAVLNLAVGWVKAIYSLKMDGKMAVMGSMTFMWHLLRLPISFFSQRMAGDLINRQEMNEEISGTLVNTVAPLLFDSGMVIMYLVVMFRYHPLLSMVGVGSILIHSGVAAIISKRRVNITRVQMRDEGRMVSYTMTGIHMIETIKAGGAENGFFAKWSGYQAAVYESRSRFVKNDIYLGIIPDLVEVIASDLVLIVGAWLVMHGQFEVGMILAFQEILELFLRPTSKTIEAGQTIREMQTEMERVEDVMSNSEDELISGVGKPAAEAIQSKLKGEIEMKNVTFGYSDHGEPLIRDFNLKVKPGQRIALVGESGCGKSTVSNLLSGMYRQWSGEILFDGRPIHEIDRSVFTGSLAVVDQEIVLFGDTIANNITMWDDTIEDFEMILAARDAGLHEEILIRDDGYLGMLAEGGNDLSGGERQRLEIARVLAQDPSILILDEATSALDAKTEQEVVNAICDRGITCIVVAHRLSTIRDCDEILVMDDGVVIERGTHEELLKNGGLYTELVSDE